MKSACERKHQLYTSAPHLLKALVLARALLAVLKAYLGDEVLWKILGEDFKDFDLTQQRIEHAFDRAGGDDALAYLKEKGNIRWNLKTSKTSKDSSATSSAGQSMPN